VLAVLLWKYVAYGGRGVWGGGEEKKPKWRPTHPTCTATGNTSEIEESYQLITTRRFKQQISLRRKVCH
jgi:hypothetical protein